MDASDAPLRPAFPTGVVDKTLLVQFFIPLPDRVPYPDLSVFTEHLEERVPELDGLSCLSVESDGIEIEGSSMFVSARFYQTRTRSNSLGTAYEAIAPVLDFVLGRRHWWQSGYASLAKGLQRAELGESDSNAATVVGAITLLRAGHEAQGELSEAFERCLEWLRLLVGAYRIRMGAPVRLPTAESMPSIVTFALRHLDDAASWDTPSMYQVGYPVWAFAAPPEAGDVDDWLEAYLEGQSTSHPTANFLEHLIEAEVAASRDGDYRAAVVLLETAVEILIDSLAGMVLFESGLDVHEGRKRFAPKSGFKNRIQMLGEFLPGEWSARAPGPVSECLDDLAALRHRVVHDGRMPRRAQIQRAFEVCRGLRDHAKCELLEAGSYPRASLTLLGKSAIERSGGLSERMEAVLSDPEQLGWLSGYTDWIRQVREEPV